MNSDKIGKYLIELRKSKNLTQEQLAERIGVSSNTISKWENGINIPDTYFLFELSKEFGVNIQDLLNGEKIYNVLDSNSLFIKAITFYNSIFKKKILRVFVSFVIILVICFSILYTIVNFNKNRVYDISSSTDKYSLNGFLVLNPKEAIFFINNFYFEDENIGLETEEKVLYYDLFIKDENGFVLYNNSNNFNQTKSLSEFLSDLNINFIINKKDYNKLDIKDINSIYIQLLYSKNMNKYNEIKINIKTLEHFSNNQILY